MGGIEFPNVGATSLQVAEERHQAFVLAPRLRRLALNRVALCQRLGLHFQVGFRVDIRRAQRFVTQLCPDGVDVDALAQQVHRRGMTDGVGRDPLPSQGRHCDGRGGRVTRHHAANAETRQRFP